MASPANVRVSMMAGHGANPIFFNDKEKDWTSRTLANPPPLLPPPLPSASNNISFLPYRSTPTSKSMTYVYHSLICNPCPDQY